MSGAHEPVMLDEIVEIFATVPQGTILDATLGGAGHAVAILRRHERLRVMGVDRDPTAVAVRPRPGGAAPAAGELVTEG